jgi:hypothetical protein
MSTTLKMEMAARARTAPWRRFVTERPLAGALVAGFVATHLATVTGYWYHGLTLTAGKGGLPDLGWPGFNGLLLVGPKESGLAQFWAGSVFHLATGMAFSLAFCFLLFPLFRWQNTVGGNIAKGIAFGLALATISAGWWVPQLFPALHAGFFSHNLGWRTVFGIYLWHIIYGVNLGALYSPLPQVVV